MTDSKDPSEYIESGKAKLNAGDYQAAIDAFTKAIDLDPNNLDIVWKRGVAKSRLGFHQKANADFNRLQEQAEYLEEEEGDDWGDDSEDDWGDDDW